MSEENIRETLNNSSEIINSSLEETEIVMPLEQWEFFVRDINRSGKQIPSLARLLKKNNIFEDLIITIF